MPVDDHITALNPDAIAGQPNNSLNVVGCDWLIVGPIVTPGVIRIPWILENYNVATLDLALRQKGCRFARGENEFVN